MVTKEAVKEAKEIYASVYQQDNIFNEAGWNHIIEVRNDFEWGGIQWYFGS